MNDEERQYVSYYAMEKVRDHERGEGYVAWWVDGRGHKRTGVLGAKPVTWKRTKAEMRRYMDWMFLDAMEYKGEVVLW